MNRAAIALMLLLTGCRTAGDVPPRPVTKMPLERALEQLPAGCDILADFPAEVGLINQTGERFVPQGTTQVGIAHIANGTVMSQLCTCTANVPFDQAEPRHWRILVDPYKEQNRLYGVFEGVERTALGPVYKASGTDPAGVAHTLHVYGRGYCMVSFNTRSRAAGDSAAAAFLASVGKRP